MLTKPSTPRKRCASRRTTLCIVLFGLILIIIFLMLLFHVPSVNISISKTNTASIHVPKNFGKVFTYLAPNTASFHYPMLERWKESWLAFGWQPIILNESHAKLHPKYDFYKRTMRNYASPNGEMEIACWLRWLAMISVGGGFLTDFDVINYGFYPTSYNDTNEEVILYTERELGVVSGSANAFEKMCDRFMRFPAPNAKLKSYWSDLAWFWAYPYFFKHIIAQQLDFDVRDTARTVLVHYPTLTNTSKLDRMVEFERKRKKSLDELRCIDEALMRNTQLQNVKEIDEKIHECSNERRVVDYLA